MRRVSRRICYWDNNVLQYQPELTMFTLLGVLLKIMKCVTPRGPAIATKSFSTLFFFTWHTKQAVSLIYKALFQ